VERKSRVASRCAAHLALPRGALHVWNLWPVLAYHRLSSLVPYEPFRDSYAGGTTASAAWFRLGLSLVDDVVDLSNATVLSDTVTPLLVVP
jgi:hypothetical protein